MEFPTQIIFHGMDREQALEDRVHDRIERLLRLCSDITACRVVIEAPEKVHLVLRLPRSVLSVTKATRKDEEIELAVAVGRAFDAAERVLKEVTHHPRAA
jgi:hypothetical protein